jgi:hypothetical protein
MVYVVLTLEGSNLYIDCNWKYVKTVYFRTINENVTVFDMKFSCGTNIQPSTNKQPMVYEVLALMVYEVQALMVYEVQAQIKV